MKAKVWKTSTIGILVLFLGSLGVNISELTEDEGYLPYNCGKETVPDMLCYKLSRVNDLGFQRYCYFDRDNSKRFKRCDVGWELLTPDEFECKTTKTIIIAYTDNGKYFCNGVGDDATCVNVDLEEMPMWAIE